MKSVSVMISLSLFLSLCSLHASQASDNRADHLSITLNLGGLSSPDSNLPASSSREISRQLAQYNARAAMTCSNVPTICVAEGSPGPDCCKQQCVNVMTDGLNCGQCGKKCKYGEACCGGGCTNVMFDGKNCGGCGTGCRKGSNCRYGMCNYA